MGEKKGWFVSKIRETLFTIFFSKGAFYGGVSGLSAMSWILYKAQTDLLSGNLTFPQKPVYTDNCTYNFEFDSISNKTHLMIEDDGYEI